MSLPASRNRTYTNGVTPVEAVDINDLQDAAIRAWASKHGDQVRKLSGMDISGTGTGNPGVTVANGNCSLSHVTGGPYYLSCPIRDGERIRSWAVHGNPGAATGLTVRLRRIDATGAVTTIQSWTSSATGWQITGPGSLDHTVVAGSTYYFVIEVSTAPSTIAGIHLTADAPP